MSDDALSENGGSSPGSAAPNLEKPKRKRGRPKKGEQPPPGWTPRPKPAVQRRRDHMQAETARVVQDMLGGNERKEAEALEIVQRRASAKVTAQAVAAIQDEPSHAFLHRVERLSWLCRQIAAEHVKETVVKVGEGYEIVDLKTSDPQFRAMDMLMRAMGDYAASDGTKVAVAIGGDQGKREPGVVLMVMDNGRGVEPEPERE